MFQTTNQIIAIITIIIIINIIIIIISTNCARLLERIPQQKINNQIRSMSKKQTSINNKNITSKNKLISFTETPQKPPLALKHFFRNRWPEAQAEMMLFQRILGDVIGTCRGQGLDSHELLKYRGLQISPSNPNTEVWTCSIIFPYFPWFS